MTALDCPVCCAPFKEIVKDGVLIDVCTECKGVWLDRGELDQLLDIAREKRDPSAHTNLSRQMIS